METKELARGIFHLDFKTQYDATATFMRPEEFYECPDPKIRGKYFTFPQLMDSYANRHGHFTYTSDWMGFNVPSHSIKKFFAKFADLSDKEKKLKKLVDKIRYPKYYIIGTYKGEDLNHELAHGFYYMSPDYHDEMKRLIERCSIRRSMIKSLKEKGYNDDQIDDEIQAYLGTEKMSYLRTAFRKIRTSWKMIPKFRGIYKKFKKELVNGKS